MRRLLVWLLGLLARDSDTYDESYRVLGIELWRRPRRFERHLEAEQPSESGVSVPDTPGARHAHEGAPKDERE